jgi:hypothetical protein
VEVHGGVVQQVETSFFPSAGAEVVDRDQVSGATSADINRRGSYSDPFTLTGEPNPILALGGVLLTPVPEASAASCCSPVCS